MEIQERIEELEGKLKLMQRTRIQDAPAGSTTVAKMTHDYRVLKWRSRIEKLAELKDSDWALGKTDTLPPGLYEGDGQPESSIY